MGQFSSVSLFVLLFVGATFAIDDFDLLLQHVDLLKAKIIHLKSGQSVAAVCLFLRRSHGVDGFKTF